METVLEIPQNKLHTYERADAEKSFDLLASIHMMRFDISRFGRVLPETKQRVCDEEFSYIAEGIDRYSYTCFRLQEINGSLSFFDKGEWRPYLGTLITGLKVAEREARDDPRKNFLADLAVRDLQVGYKLEAMENGEVLIWDSPYMHEEHERYGEEFMTSVGLQPKRRMGFIYRAEKHQDGSMTLESHTVDRSDEEAYAAVRKKAEDDPGANMEELLEAYDQVLRAKYGREFYAGRELNDDHMEENAWEFVTRNRPLAEFYMTELEKLAYSNLEGEELEYAKRRLTYGTWARVKELLDEQTKGLVNYEWRESVATNDDYAFTARQVEQALYRASLRHEVMTGCGGSINPVDDFLRLDPKDALDSIFGKKSKQELSWHGGVIKKGTCVNCHEGPKDVGKENWCKDCIGGHCGAK